MTSSLSHRVPGWLVLIGAMSALGPFTIDMYLPGFPAIEREFGETGVERTMASYLLGLAFGQLVYGPVSDRFGRKPPLYFGLVLYVAGAIGCAFATNMAMLTIMRILQAVGACAPLVIGRAIVRDRCEPHEAAKAYATLMLIVSLGPIIAPLLGGFVITALGWRAVFVFLAIAGLVIIAAMHTMLVESRDPAHVRPLRFGSAMRSYGRLLLDRVFVGYCCVGGFAMAGLFCYVAGSPNVMAQEYGLTPQQFGWMIGLNGIAFMSASRLNIIALRKSTPAAVLARYVWWPAVFSALMVIGSHVMHLPLWVVLILQFGFFLMVGRANPNVAALALVPFAHEAGTASALMGAIQSALGMLIGLAVAAFVHDTLFELALLMLFCAIATGVAYLFTRKASTARDAAA
jgi:DHA1 family bicyclomycin/chloramphenicol resistance-like MFS transporter